MAIFKSPVLAALTVLSALPQCLSLPTTTPNINTREAVPAELCADNATIQDLWTVESLRVTYAADLTRGSGRSTFKLTNTRTNFTEELSCALRANYVCEYRGTPADPGLNIWMQLHIETAYVTINQSWACGGSSSAYAVGMAEVTLTCPDDFYEQGLACVGADEEGSASGVVTVPPSESTLLKRAVAGVVGKMAHKIESIGTTIKPKSTEQLSSTNGHHLNRKEASSGLQNQDFADELRRKTWKALGSFTHSRRGNGLSNSQIQTRRGKAEEKKEENPVGLYPLPKSQQEAQEKNKQMRLKNLIKEKVDIEHLCSPSCRGDGPKPPAGKSGPGLKGENVGGQKRTVEEDDVLDDVVRASSGSGIWSSENKRRRTSPVKPGIVFVDV